MKKLYTIGIAVLLTAFGLNAQAKDINLVCDVTETEESIWEISFNTETSKGMISSLPSELRVTNSEYVMWGPDGNSIVTFKVNRETLDTSIVTTFTGSLDWLDPIIRKGKCSIAPKNSNVI